MTEDRTRRLDMAERALARAQERMEKWAGPCHACVHWRSLHGWGGGVTEYDRCTNPLVLAQHFDNVLGAEVDVRCTRARSSSGLCGPNGVLFERPERDTRTWWQRLLS